MGSDIRKFTQIAFENEPSENTPLSASNLNAIQTRINDLFNDLPNGTLNVVTNANEEQIEGVYIISSTGTSNFPFDTTATNFKRGFLIVLRRYGQRDIMQIAIAPLKKSIWIRTGVTGTGTIQSLSAWTRLYEPPTILYEDLTSQNGTQNDVTLSDSSTNYDFLEIYYARTTGTGSSAPKSCVKIDNPNGKYVNMFMNHYTDESAIGMQIYADKVHINGNKIERIGSCLVGFSSGSVSQYNVREVGSLYIYRVIGYKIAGGEV